MRATAHKTYLMDKPDILSVLEREGVAVLRRGARYVARCVAHSPDKNPSMVVYPDSGKLHCFACGFHGDSFDVVMKLRGLSFKEAKRSLGLEKGRPDAAKIAENKEKQELVAAFRAWEKKTRDDIALAIRLYRHYQATHKGPFTESELADLARFQGEVDYLGYVYEILCSKDNASKLKLFLEDLSIYG